MKNYTELTDETEISLDASRHWLRQRGYWMVTAAVALIDVPTLAQILHLTSSSEIVALGTRSRRKGEWRGRSGELGCSGLPVHLRWDTPTMPLNAPLIQNEREGLLTFLEHQREAVRNATHGLREDQARFKPTPSGLSLGGLVKHLTDAEQGWTDRVLGVPPSDTAFGDYMASFVLSADETLAAVLRRYDETCAHTDAVIGGIDDLGRRVALPEAPWFPDPEDCTVRWILFHLIEETARHAGHADIIREALDGALSGPLMAAVEGWPEDGWVKPWRPQN
ncbi:MAG TPA: DinB family protein [Acidimicrobiales bacterium]|nr:DinB family protein [Acidimicrobiales bacterium]